MAPKRAEMPQEEKDAHSLTPDVIRFSLLLLEVWNEQSTWQVSRMEERQIDTR